jgi:hypothetical protein
MDIANIKPSERVLEIHHPADEDEKLGIRVSIVSINDPRLKKVKRKIQDEKLRLDARGKHFKSDDVEDNLHTMIFSAMTGWEWYSPTGKKEDDASFHGKKPEFNRASVLAVFSECEFIVDQLSEAISDEKAFFQNSKAI